MTRHMLTLHRWLGLVAGVMILIAAGTAIGLNHQDLLKRQTSGGGTQSPYRKYLLAIAADPANPSRLLAGTNDGLFRSSDGGRTWEEAVLPVPAEGAGAIAFDPERPGVVYVALREIGLYMSEDRGEVWEEVPLPFQPPEGTQIAGLSLLARGGLLLATTEGVWRRPAGGGEWHHTPKSAAPAAEESRRVVQLIYDLHDGRFWGTYGVPITDAVSVALIVLVLSGYTLFFVRVGRRNLAGRRTNLVALAAPAPAAPVSEATAGLRRP